MNGKALAAILTIVGVITAIIGGGHDAKVNDFQSWKAKYNMNFNSQFE